MSRTLSRFAGVLTLVVLFSGCDALNDAINDALPEVGISDGLFGLGGEAGTELSGTFSDGGKAAATAQFSITENFDDLNSGDISEVEALKTSIILALSTGNASIILSNPSGAALPASIGLQSATVNWTLSDSRATQSGGGTTAINATLTRNASCAATATSCGYALSAPAGIVIRNVTLSGATALALYAIVAESAPPTPNTFTMSISLTVSNSASELTGMSATIRVGESNTTVQPILF